jgi:nickel transport protein
MPETTAHHHAVGLGLGALALFALSASPGRSHGIQSNLEKVSPLSEQVRREFLLQSEFSTGEPAGDATVRLLRADGETIELGRTDGEGRLRFEVPRDAATDWELQVDAGPGHRDYLELSEAGGSQAAEPLAPSPATSAAGLPSWRRTGLGRLLAQRPAGAVQPLMGGLAVGLVGAAGMMLVARRRR